MYAVHRPVDNPYLVRERDQRRTRELLAFTLAALPPMAVLFAAIWANLETVRLGYQLESMQKQKETLIEKRRQLLMDRAQRSSLDRVEKVARLSLGLVTPKGDQLILVEDGSFSAGVPTPEPAPALVPPVEDELVGPPAPPSTEEGF